MSDSDLEILSETEAPAPWSARRRSQTKDWSTTKWKDEAMKTADVAKTAVLEHQQTFLDFIAHVQREEDSKFDTCLCCVLESFLFLCATCESTDNLISVPARRK